MARKGLITAIGNVPIPESLYNHRTQIPGAAEVVDKNLWDTQTYLAAGSAALTFFQAGNASVAVTNMETGGQLAGGKSFLIRAIGVQVWPVDAAAWATATLTDINTLIQRGVLRLFIGNKDYSEWPLFLLSEGGGIAGSVTTGVAATDVAMIGNGVPDPRASYTLMRPLLLENQINFRARIEWPAAPAVAADKNVRVIFSGDMGRPIQ